MSAYRRGVGSTRARIGTLLLVAAAGIVIGLGAFALTSGHEPGRHDVGICLGDEVVHAAHFDPWTGRGMGLVVICSETSGAGPWQMHAGVSADMLGRRAISVPVGFLIGAGVEGGVLLMMGRYRRKYGRRGLVDRSPSDILRG